MHFTVGTEGQLITNINKKLQTVSVFTVHFKSLFKDKRTLNVT